MIDNLKLQEVLQNHPQNTDLSYPAPLKIISIQEFLEKNSKYIGNVMPVSELLKCVQCYRTMHNIATRQIIDKEVERTFNQLICRAHLDSYGSVKAVSDIEWQRDYFLLRTALLLSTAQDAFSLNGDGIQGISGMSPEWGKPVVATGMNYNTDEFRLLQPKKGNLSVLKLKKHPSKPYSVDLNSIIARDFPKDFCPHFTEACGFKVDGLDSVCLTSSRYTDCQVYQSLIDDGR